MVQSQAGMVTLMGCTGGSSTATATTAVGSITFNVLLFIIINPTTTATTSTAVRFEHDDPTYRHVR